MAISKRKAQAYHVSTFHIRRHSKHGKGTIWYQSFLNPMTSTWEDGKEIWKAKKTRCTGDASKGKATIAWPLHNHWANNSTTPCHVIKAPNSNAMSAMPCRCRIYNYLPRFQKHVWPIRHWTVEWSHLGCAYASEAKEKSTSYSSTIPLGILPHNTTFKIIVTLLNKLIKYSKIIYFSLKLAE